MEEIYKKDLVKGMVILKISISYSNVNNMGDALNKDLIEHCFNCNVIRKSPLFAKVSGIGSGLGTYRYGNDLFSNIKKKVFGFCFPKVYVWGTGFISYKDNEKPFYKKDMVFCAVRGNLTKKRVELQLNKKLDNVALGDGGILASYMINENIEKKYDIGIIPHFREKDEDCFKKLKDSFENSTVIDVQDSPTNVIKKIGECKTIASSSLHGLILSDSLRVPNIHIVATKKLMGDGFKFDDYYSAYNIDHQYIDLNTEKLNSIEEIEERYKVTDEMVEKMKQDMINCFPIKNS